MKNFILGLVVGIVLASTGTYAIAQKQFQKATSKQNMKKVAKAAEDFTKTIQGVFE